MFKNFDEFFAAISNSNNYNSFMKNYFGKTNDYISLAIDTAKVGLSSIETFLFSNDDLKKIKEKLISNKIIKGDEYEWNF